MKQGLDNTIFPSLSPQSSRKPRVFCVVGPTSCGKSAFSSLLAQKYNGTVINADSMQLYHDLRILTARPSESEEKRVPHRLYGVLKDNHKGNVAWWLNAVHGVIEDTLRQGCLPILCGGTGMYFHTLVNGLARMPYCSDEVHHRAIEIVEEQGSEAIHAWLKAQNPDNVGKIHPTDSQRIIRAWEVYHVSGRSIGWWQKQPGVPPAPYRFCGVYFKPERLLLSECIEKRFYKMVKAGAVDEVRALIERKPDPVLPVMRAHGVPEIIALIRGELSRDEAFLRAIASTRRYAKRQQTWFNHHQIAPKGQMETIEHLFDPKIDLKQVEEKFFA